MKKLSPVVSAATSSPEKLFHVIRSSFVESRRQIGQQIRVAILERRLALGLKLPSSRLLAAELGCARGTILLAIDQLVAEGYVLAQAASVVGEMMA